MRSNGFKWRGRKGVQGLRLRVVCKKFNASGILRELRAPGPWALMTGARNRPGRKDWVAVKALKLSYHLLGM